MWLLIVCLAHANGYCDTQGSLSTQMVTEAQCVAVAKAFVVDKNSNMKVWCFAPEGPKY